MLRAKRSKDFLYEPEENQHGTMPLEKHSWILFRTWTFLGSCFSVFRPHVYFCLLTAKNRTQATSTEGNKSVPEGICVVGTDRKRTKILYLANYNAETPLKCEFIFFRYNYNIFCNWWLSDAKDSWKQLI